MPDEDHRPRPRHRPEASKPLLAKSIEAFGRLPSLHGVMAGSPGLLEGYQTLHRLAVEDTAFDPAERTVVWQAVNVRHACHYCVPAHTAIANAEKIDPAVTRALRDETPLPEPKLEALRAFTLAVVDTRGRPSPEQLAAFEAAGYGERAMLDVVLIVAQKIMSNHTNALFDTPHRRRLRALSLAIQGRPGGRVGPRRTVRPCTRPDHPA